MTVRGAQFTPLTFGSTNKGWDPLYMPLRINATQISAGGFSTRLKPAEHPKNDHTQLSLKKSGVAPWGDLSFVFV